MACQREFERCARSRIETPTDPRDNPRVQATVQPRRRPAALLFVALGLAALIGPGCAAHRPTDAGSASTPPPPDDRAPLEWARDEEMFVLVRRSCRNVSVYRYGEWLRTYDEVSFGREKGTKLHEGDRRTPSGLYRIVGRRHHPRWSRFLLIDYPNLKDVAVHREAFDAGLAPASPGNLVGLHGTDEPKLNEMGVDWTLGCISLQNQDVRDLYDLVPDGTLVLIED